ncbi:DUF1127 domain-containing protein [Psychromarinibacter sp. S121]|uniref:DUF1127 domain-containing protein n=1 Tax=Psychromarinibacter sp. S121 TaxID=3415127 RepID=UPI003C7A50C1
MKAKINDFRRTMAERREARQIYRATRHLDAHIMRDIGLNRDDYHDRVHRI